MNLRGRPIAVRVLAWCSVVLIALVVGYAAGLLLIFGVVAVFGHGHGFTLRGVVVVGLAYAVTGAITLGAAVLAYRHLFGSRK